MGIAAPLELPKGMVEGGRRARASEKAGEGKTVRDLTRMLVIVSGWIRCGLNWYLPQYQHMFHLPWAEEFGIVVRFQIELINNLSLGFR